MTSVEEIAGLLGRTPIFSGMSPRDLTQLAEVAVPRSYLGGEGHDGCDEDAAHWHQRSPSGRRETARPSCTARRLRS